jgi:hypothetical protein
MVGLLRSSCGKTIARRLTTALERQPLEQNDYL